MLGARLKADHCAFVTETAAGEDVVNSVREIFAKIFQTICMVVRIIDHHAVAEYAIIAEIFVVREDRAEAFFAMSCENDK